MVFNFQNLEKESTLSYGQANRLLNEINKTTSDFAKNKQIIVKSYYDAFDSLGNKYNDSINKIEEYEIKSNEGFIYRLGDLAVYHSDKLLITVNKKEKFIFIKKTEEENNFPPLFNYTKNKLDKKNSILCQLDKEKDKTELSFTDTTSKFGQRIVYNTDQKIIISVQEFKIVKQNEQIISKRTYAFNAKEGKHEIDLLATEYLNWKEGICQLNPKYKSYRLILIP
jgi:hypothetical protein